MNKVKVVALATLVAVSGGNMHAAYDISLKKKKELTVLLSAFLGAASGGAYYSTGKGGTIYTLRGTLKDWDRKHPIRTFPGRKQTVKEGNALFANGSLTANGRRLTKSALIGTVVFGVLNLGLDAFLDGFTVRGLLRSVDKNLEKAEGIVSHPYGDLVNAEKLKAAIESLQASQNAVAEYLEQKPLEVQLEDGYLNAVIKRKDKIGQLLGKLYTLEENVLKDQA